ncbi:MAG: arginine--tRNA ligase [Deferribacteraceae bacterium]|jgi:arginyl-tRNA synthetase|nr:arginine--tRNA ligase [Deferribacteraceae bacterium]
MKERLRSIIKTAVEELYPGAVTEEIRFSVEYTDNPQFGDIAANIAMQLAKSLRKNPKVIAEEIAAKISDPYIKKAEAAGTGFVNIFLSDTPFHEWLSSLLNAGESRAPLRPVLGAGKKALVEFVSANPTGPLHIGHGRGAVVGDNIANILEAAGYKVKREYYVNDAGNQMTNLAASIFSRYSALFDRQLQFPQDGYHGEYIAEIAKDIKREYDDSLFSMTEASALEICRKEGIKTILNCIDGTLKLFKVKVDDYFSETSLYEGGNIDRTLKKMETAGCVYEQDGALWFASSRFGDTEDRVLKKSDGSYTYLAPDIAYHDGKFDRGYDLLVDVWGSDHHGYIKRLECALEVLGHNGKKFDVVLVQMVGLVNGGERMVMSTRKGQFITLDWLINETGSDAARFFYNMRSPDSQFEFDVELAKQESTDNPVYYVQYAHARISGLMEKAEIKGIPTDYPNLSLLTEEKERSVIKKLMEMKDVIAACAQYNEPHRLSYYLTELAGEFHSYYYSFAIADENAKELSGARLALCKGVASALKFGLNLLGVTAPDSM